MSKLDILFETFTGDFVEVLLDQVVTITQADEDGITTKTKPLVITGYLLDMDDDYIYLGDTPDEVTDAFKKAKIVGISISKPKDKYDDILNQFESEVQN